MVAHVEPALRFWDKAVPVGDCLVWTSTLDSHGYGRFYPTGRVHVLAHRFAYMLINGEVPSTVVIRHSCDNPPCINPDHLIAGTQEDNVRDRDERGRTSKGSRHYKWRSWTDDEVSDIVASGEAGVPVRRIARAHRTRKATVQAIIRGDRRAGA